MYARHFSLAAVLVAVFAPFAARADIEGHLCGHPFEGASSIPKNGAVCVTLTGVLQAERDDIFPDGLVYVTTNQTWPGGGLNDVTGGGANLFVTMMGGGLVFDEL